ncbi:LutC/YkgG family protein [Pararhodospirillum oryzae]|uniref:LUD domain-containing protein n=1 Tax=Pararhodospirillum oryzae TaxID=478448 RepID=A0A512H5Y8_9PROT|nr:lactate utilization protein [Pararhodospirillum oryzae]GEO80879.1 hypothetical protein ROR02_10100 [Pararhodospirillum oryzae]
MSSTSSSHPTPQPAPLSPSPDAPGRLAVRAAVRAALGRDPATEAAARDAIVARLATPGPGPVPTRARPDDAGRVDAFIARARAAAAEVSVVPGGSTTDTSVLPDGSTADTSVLPGGSAAGLPARLGHLIAEWLRGHGLPPVLVTDDDPFLAALDGVSGLSLRPGRPSPTDRVSLCRGLAGVAETGSVLLDSRPGRAATLAVLPENQIVVLDPADVVGGLNDAVTRLRAGFGTTLPASVMIVTGPSRTGDIEQTLQMGAHGPLRLHIILVDRPVPDRP